MKLELILTLDQLTDYAGSKYAVAVDSCTNALFLSMKYCKDHLKYEGPVTVPTHTYISVPMQVKHAGFDVKFKGVYWEGSYKLGSIPVYDSAQQFTKDMYVRDTFYCLSFHFKKILSTIKGGMILTDDETAADWFRRGRYDGRPTVMYNDLLTKPVYDLGYHMYMTPEQAVMGINNFYSVNGINDDSGCSNDYAVDLSKLECFK